MLPAVPPLVICCTYQELLLVSVIMLLPPVPPVPPVPAVAHAGAPPGAAAVPPAMDNPEVPPGGAPPGAAADDAPQRPFRPESIDYINLYNSPKYSLI